VLQLAALKGVFADVVAEPVTFVNAPLLAKERGGRRIRQQVLFYPVTDAAFDTESYHQFATGYFLRRDAMMWFWDQYTTNPGERNEITASPLRASTEQLKGLPPALIIRECQVHCVNGKGSRLQGDLRSGSPVG